LTSKITILGFWNFLTYCLQITKTFEVIAKLEIVNEDTTFIN